MELVKLMFGSPYDQAGLVAMVIGLAIHAAIDLSRRRRAGR